MFILGSDQQKHKTDRPPAAEPQYCKQFVWLCLHIRRACFGWRIVCIRRNAAERRNGKQMRTNAIICIAFARLYVSCTSGRGWVSNVPFLYSRIFWYWLKAARTFVSRLGSTIKIFELHSNGIIRRKWYWIVLQIRLNVCGISTSRTFEISLFCIGHVYSQWWKHFPHVKVTYSHSIV